MAHKYFRDDDDFEDNCVKKVTWKAMDGETELEKRVNAYLTKTFILEKNVPSDECLEEARAVIKMIKNFDL